MPVSPHSFPENSATLLVLALKAGASQRVPLPQCRNGRVNWGTMTDESQAMVKKVGLISLGGVILLAFSKMIFPLVLLGGGSYVAWRALFKK